MSTVLQPIAHNAQEVGGAAKGAKANDTAIHSALLRDQVEERCRALMRDAEDAALSIEQELEIQLVKLPKKVRLMSLTEFQDAHGGDLASAVVGSGSSAAPLVPGTAPRTTRRGRAAADSAVTPAVGASEVPKAVGRTTRKRAAAATGSIDEAQAQAAAVRPRRGRAAGAELQTPAPSFSAQLPPPSAVVPGTTSRIAMPGEVVYSERGSPVLVPATVVHGAGVGRSRLPPSQQQQAAAAEAVAAAAPAALPVPLTGLMLTTCSRIARTAARTTGRAAQKHEPTVGKGRKKRTAAAKKKAEEEAAAAAAAEAEQQEGHEVVPALALTTEDGKQIPLEQGLAQLPAELQAEATRQLESLKGLVDSLLGGAAGADSRAAEEEKAKQQKSDGEEKESKGAKLSAAAVEDAEESRPKQRRQPTRKRSAVEEPKEDTKRKKEPKKEEEPKEEAKTAAKTPGVGRGGRKSTSMQGVQKGKWVILATDVEEEKFTQPVPGHPGSFYYVAKVLERDGASMKIHYYATDGPNRKWFEGISRLDGKRHVEERAVDRREIIAVFEGLTKCHKKIPAAVMTEIQSRLQRAPVTPGN